MLSIPDCHLRTGVLGFAMGLVLSRLGFSNFGEVHEMFLFRDLRLVLAFAAAVAVAALGFRFAVSTEGRATHRIHPGTIPGGLLFGAGWALTGACPAIVWVQIGEGQLVASVTVVGIALGTWLYPRVHKRFFRWPTESCQG